MKKVLSLLLVLTMAFSLVACGNKSTTSTTTNTTATTTTNNTAATTTTTNTAATTNTTAAAATSTDYTKLKVGVLIRTFSDTYTTTVRTALEKYLKGYNISDYEIMDANESQATQNEQLQTFLSKGVNVIICQLATATAFKDIETACDDANTPVVFFNGPPSDLTVVAADDLAAFVGTNTAEAGYMQADLFMQYWDNNAGGTGKSTYDRNGDGKCQYVIFEGTTDSQEALDRTKYCVDGATDKGYKMEALADPYLCEWDSNKAQEAMSGFLGTNQDKIECVFCNNDSMAEGVVNALNAVGYNTGKSGDTQILVFGIDATDAGVQLIKDGKLTATVKQDGDGMGKCAVELAVRMASGMKKMDAITDAGYTVDDTSSVRIPYQKYTGE